METSNDHDSCGSKRNDVGYKRPPIETRFKKGQKPPPRKKKVRAEVSAKDVFWKVLQERRRVVIDSKPAWLTNAELIARRAFLEAERGSPVLARLLNQLLLQSERPSDEDVPEMVILSKDESGGFDAGMMTIRDAPPEAST